MRHWPDFGIILVLLVSKAAVGFWEEDQAGNAIAALKAQLALQRTRYSDKPEAWNVRLVPGIAAVLGLAGVVSSFALFAERVFHLGRDVVPTFMFLKVAAAGRLTIFLTRTRGPFWSSRPAPILLWRLIWGCAQAWFCLNDGVKLAAYRIFDSRQIGLLATIPRSTPAAG